MRKPEQGSQWQRTRLDQGMIVGMRREVDGREVCEAESKGLGNYLQGRTVLEDPESQAWVPECLQGPSLRWDNEETVQQARSWLPNLCPSKGLGATWRQWEATVKQGRNRVRFEFQKHPTGCRKGDSLEGRQWRPESQGGTPAGENGVGLFGVEKGSQVTEWTDLCDDQQKWPRAGRWM